MAAIKCPTPVKEGVCKIGAALGSETALRELWYTIVLESLMLLGVGCFSGAVFGLFGQQLLDRALNIVINYPVVSSVGVVVALSSLALVTASAVLMVAIPGWFAAKVQASLALQD